MRKCLPKTGLQAKLWGLVLIIGVGWPIPGGTSGKVVLAIRKQTEQAVGSKPVSNTFPWLRYCF